VHEGCAESADGSDQNAKNAREEPQGGNDLPHRAVSGVCKTSSEEGDECDHGPDDDDRMMIATHVEMDYFVLTSWQEKLRLGLLISSTKMNSSWCSLNPQPAPE
jgi:hypothetical protein